MFGQMLLQYKQMAEDSTRQQFPTYDTAIAEIIRLQQQAFGNKPASQKHPKGRPRYIEIFGVKITPDGKVILPKEKKERGRPKRTPIAEMRELIAKYEGFKDIAANYRKPSDKRLSDREIVAHLVNATPDLKLLRRDKKKEIIDRISKEIKYWRDETGLRQRGKRKNQKIMPAK